MREIDVFKWPIAGGSIAIRETAVLPALPAGTRADRHQTAISGRPAPKNAPKARKSPPADLLAFVRTQSPTAAAQALGLARRTVARLRDGYWPRNPEKIVRAWRTYAGHLAEQRSGWFLRRVYAGGVVRHARAAWGSPALAARVGQVLVCTRAADGALLAQTLALPAERFLLAPVTNA